VGIDYQYIEARLSKEPVPGTYSTSMEGDDRAWGYNLGLLYLVDDATRVGLSYRSTIDYRLQGTLSGNLPSPPSPFPLPQSIQADITMPAMASFAVQRRIDERWTVMADATWTGWGRFDKLDVYLASGAGPIDHTDESWQDAWRFGVGAEYRANDTWTWRFGMAYDQTPIPDAAHRTPRIPDSDRVSVAVGGRYRASRQAQVDFGYMHIFFNDSSTATPAGNYRGRADILGVQLAYGY
jgi:long-chain fatty acid transport protein